MPGTQDGKYFPFARRGKVLLGVRPVAIESRRKFGVAGTTYFAARIRSAPNNGLFPSTKGEGNVVAFNPPGPVKLDEA